ncbi:Protein Rf1, mitochondrial [Neolecta irregularis DAH-3]|uniref:Protein Rf1, mitochondrial n=1 Tax=Neolecta irregularis (strain DAH-3) TaxID=1198029 RepID=A0A1U7LI70_NEOID|nr:Protein Rf1, mitochondrial [Neolecta irregularis DAH-3]|eukprot:OLL22356.1 Protein Rf1, mitochondrial [Neolecta irregularis DAH-3]
MRAACSVLLTASQNFTHRPLHFSSLVMILRTKTTTSAKSKTLRHVPVPFPTTREDNIYILEKELGKKNVNIYSVMESYARVYSEGKIKQVALRNQLFPSIIKERARAEIEREDKEILSSTSLLAHFESVDSPGDDCYNAVMWSNILRGKYHEVFHLWKRRNLHAVNTPLQNGAPWDSDAVEVAIFTAYLAPKFTEFEQKEFKKSAEEKSEEKPRDKLQFEPADFAKVFKPSKQGPRFMTVKQILQGKALPRGLKEFVVEQAQLLESYYNLLDTDALIPRLKTHFNCGRTKHVDYIYSLIKSKELPSSVYACLISGYVEAGTPSKASSVWKDIIDLGITPDGTLWDALLDGAANLPDKTALEQTWTKMLKAGVEPTCITCTTMIKGWFACGEVNAALSLFQKMNDKSFHISPTSWTCNIVLSGLIKNKRIEQAMSMLESAEKVGNRWDIVAYNTVLQALLRKNRKDDITILLRRMAKNGMKPDIVTFTTVLTGLSHIPPDKESMKALFEGMYKAGIEPNIVTFGAVISKLVDDNQMFPAQQVLNHMIATNIRPNLIILTKMIEGYMTCGKTESALKLFKGVRELKIVPEHGTWHRLIDGFGKHGNIDEMMTYYNLMKASIPPNRFTYSYVLNHLVQSRKLGLAESVLKDMNTAGYVVDSAGLKAAVMRVMLAGARVQVRFS